jgi:hypothetical protein
LEFWFENIPSGNPAPVMHIGMYIVDKNLKIDYGGCAIDLQKRLPMFSSSCFMNPIKVRLYSG